MDVPDPYRGTTWTLAQANEYAKAGLFYGVRSIARNGQDWLLNSLYKTTSNTLNWQDAPYAYVLPAGQRDPYAVYEILRTMELGKVEIDRATAPFTAGGKSYAAGSYVLRTQQPIGRWVNQLLDDATYPTWAKPCSSCPLTMPYSEFTDRIPLLFGITAEPIEDAFTAADRARGEGHAGVGPAAAAAAVHGRLPRPAGLLRHRQAARQPAEVGRADVPRGRRVQRGRA